MRQLMTGYTMKSGFLNLLSCLYSFSVFGSRCLSAQVLLSEVMFDPSGPELSDEFVEIVFHASGGIADLEGWTLGDGESEDRITGTGRGTLLAAGQYAVILDSDYFSSGRNYESLIPENALVLSLEGNTFGSGGFSNSRSESVILKNIAGDTVAQYRYSVGNVSGYSDEKVELGSGDSDENWCDSCVRLGTPGFRNSVAAAVNPVFAIQVFPSPFTPDGDGVDDETVVTYSLPMKTGWVQMTLFDVKGRRIRSLVPGLQSGPEGFPVWKGEDDSGRPADQGVYIVFLEALNHLDGTRVSAKTTVVLMRE